MRKRRKRGSPPNNLNNWSNLVKEIAAFIEKYGTPGVMPTRTALYHKNRKDLVEALKQHGNWSELPEKFGLTKNPPQKPAPEWEQFYTVAKELINFITQYGQPEVMPTKSQLNAAGKYALLNSIDYYGGLDTIRQRLGLRTADAKKPAKQNSLVQPTQSDDLATQLLAFSAEQGKPDTMPTSGQLAAAGRRDLIYKIGKRGGFIAVTQELGLVRDKTGKPIGYWDSFFNVVRELYDFMESHNFCETMPAKRDFQQAGRIDLAGAMIRHGGMRQVARRLGLQTLTSPEPKPLSRQRLVMLKKELYRFMAEHSLIEVMPTKEQLLAAQREDLLDEINTYGGVEAVAQRLRLKVAKNSVARLS